jgi:hypothetical protein
LQWRPGAASDDRSVVGGATLMRRPIWRVVALVATSAVLAASCSTSTSAVKQPKKPHVSHSTAHRTKAHKSKTVLGVYGNGGSITGNTGAGTNTGQGLALPGTLATPGGNSPTAAGGTTTTTVAGSISDIAAMTGTTGVPGVTTPQFRVSKTGRVLHRHLVPAISKFRPVSSPVGSTVEIVGKRLSHATAVAFDGIQATITSNSSTRIRAVVPAGATSGPISVVTTSGSATVSGFVVD